MSIYFIIIILCIIGVLLSLTSLVLTLRRLAQRRVFKAFGHSFSTVVFSSITIIITLFVVNFYALHALTKNQAIAMISLNQLAPEKFEAVLSLPSGQIKRFVLLGDDWQLSAQVVVWNQYLQMLGLKSRYRLSRISGRYDQISDELKKPHRFYALNQQQANFWQWGKQHIIERYFVKTIMGSAVFMPMVDGASYTIALGSQGLVATPINTIAKHSVGL